VSAGSAAQKVTVNPGRVNMRLNCADAAFYGAAAAIVGGVQPEQGSEIPQSFARRNRVQ